MRDEQDELIIVPDAAVVDMPVPLRGRCSRRWGSASYRRPGNLTANCQPTCTPAEAQQFAGKPRRAGCSRGCGGVYGQ
jgi:hypothetical protein